MKTKNFIIIVFYGTNYVVRIDFYLLQIACTANMIMLVSTVIFSFIIPLYSKDVVQELILEELK